MAIVNSNDVELLIAVTSPAANAADTTFQTIGHCTSLSLDISRENIVITSKASRSYVERIPGQRDWTASGDGFSDYAQATQPIAGTSTDAADTANVSELFGFQDAGTEIFIRFGVGSTRFIGSGFFTSVSQSGGTDEAPTYSFSLEGNGPITFDEDTTS